MTVLSSTVHRARRAHRCIWCGEAIEAGTQYHRSNVAHEGTVQSSAWHLECIDDAQDLLRGEIEFTPYSADRPEKEST